MTLSSLGAQNHETSVWTTGLPVAEFDCMAGSGDCTTAHLTGRHWVICNLIKPTSHSGGGDAGIPDDLNLGLDDKGVGNSEAFQHFGQLHELLPAPVMLLLTEPVQGVCRKESSNIRQGYQAWP